MRCASSTDEATVTAPVGALNNMRCPHRRTIPVRSYPLEESVAYDGFGAVLSLFFDGALPHYAVTAPHGRCRVDCIPGSRLLLKHSEDSLATPAVNLSIGSECNDPYCNEKDGRMRSLTCVRPSQSPHRALGGDNRPGTTCFVLRSTHHRPHEARAHHVPVHSHVIWVRPNGCWNLLRSAHKKFPCHVFSVKLGAISLVRPALSHTFH